MKTPEELAEEWIRSNASYLMPMRIRDTFFAGYHSRDEEIAKLREEIAMLKAELREVGNDTRD
jgi:ribosomal protein L11 methylase PrmA